MNGKEQKLLTLVQDLLLRVDREAKKYVNNNLNHEEIYKAENIKQALSWLQLAAGTCMRIHLLEETIAKSRCRVTTNELLQSRDIEIGTLKLEFEAGLKYYAKYQGLPKDDILFYVLGMLVA